MKKFGEALRNIVLATIILGIVFAAGYYVGSNVRFQKSEVVSDSTDDKKLPTETEKRIVTVDEVKTKLVEIEEFSTYSAEYTVKRSEDEARYLLDGDLKIPGTTNTITLECTGIVKVGYDVSDIMVEIDNDDQIISIVLPEPSVNDNYVIWDTVTYSEKNNILHPIEFSQYQNLIEEVEEEGLKQAEDQGIYRKAEENFKKLIEGFCAGFDGYEVVFE